MKQRSDQDLVKASERVSYEINMLFGSLIAPSQGTINTNISIVIIRNAFLESFLIHARNLINFFYTDTSRFQDDILASQFFHSDEKLNEWKMKRGEKKPLFSIVDEDFDGRSLERRIDKRLAHLTWDSIDNPKPKWPMVDIAHEIFDVIYIFYEFVDRKLLSTEYCEHVQWLLQYFIPGNAYGHLIPGKRVRMTSEQIQNKLELTVKLQGKKIIRKSIEPID